MHRMQWGAGFIAPMFFLAQLAVQQLQRENQKAHVLTTYLKSNNVKGNHRFTNIKTQQRMETKIGDNQDVESSIAIEQSHSLNELWQVNTAWASSSTRKMVYLLTFQEQLPSFGDNPSVAYREAEGSEQLEWEAISSPFGKTTVFNLQNRRLYSLCVRG